MKKGLNKNICGLAITSMLVTSIFIPYESNTASAAPTTITTTTKSINEADAKFVNEFRSVKKKVKKYKQWSKYKRVSDNVKTKNHTGSITTDRTKSWTGSASGDLRGINYSIGKTVSSSIGHTLDVPKNSDVYMGYRDKYAVEEGINYRTDMVTGEVLSKKKYKIKKTLYGQYALVGLK